MSGSRNDPESQNSFQCPICKKICKSHFGINIHLGKAHPQCRRAKILKKYQTVASITDDSPTNASTANIEDHDIESDSQVKKCDIMKEWKEKMSNVLVTGNTADLEKITDVINNRITRTSSSSRKIF